MAAKEVRFSTDAKEIELADRFENMGAQMVREVAAMRGGGMGAMGGMDF